MSTTSFDDVIKAFLAVRPELEKTIADTKSALSSYSRRKVQANESEVHRLELKRDKLLEFISLMDSVGVSPGQIPRDEMLSGATYKLSPPIIDEAVYLTINSIDIGGHPRPVEVFVNSKNMQNFQWISALTRLLSASLQQPGPFPTFILRELQDVHDPQGSFWLNKKQYPSIVSLLGFTLEEHCKKLGAIK